MYDIHGIFSFYSVLYNIIILVKLIKRRNYIVVIYTLYEQTEAVCAAAKNTRIPPCARTII